jgi:hypothetical protein
LLWLQAPYTVTGLLCHPASPRQPRDQQDSSQGLHFFASLLNAFSHHMVHQCCTIKLPTISKKLGEELFLCNAIIFKLNPGSWMLGGQELLQ